MQKNKHIRLATSYYKDINIKKGSLNVSNKARKRYDE